MPRHLCAISGRENILYRRTQVNYEEDLRKCDVSKTGVKSESIFNSIPGFHVTENYCPDIMHDILEGVAPLDLKIVLRHFIDQRFLTLEEINRRLTGFDYGYLKKDKPCPFSSKCLTNSDTLLGQSAAQTFCLVKSMTFLFGDRFEEENQNWELFLTLLDILDILLSPCVSESSLPYLKSLIEDHHQLYRTLAGRGLRPKHHHMLHYPESIRQVGPLLYYWTMRFEARHKFFKHVATLGSNFKNIAKSVSSKNQLLLSYKLFLNKSFEKFEIQCTGKVLVKSTLLGVDMRDIIQDYFGSISDYDIFSYKTITVNGLSVKPKDIVLETWLSGNEMPQFLKIHQIIKIKESYMLVVNKVSTIRFSRHFHSFVVELGEDQKVVRIENIDLPRPLLTYTNQKNEFLVCLPFMIS